MHHKKFTIYAKEKIDTTTIRGILFDMDGLVLDTEKLYTRFWQEAAQYFGYPMTKEQALGMRSLNRNAGIAQLESYFGKGIDYEAIRNKRIELMNVFVEKEGVTLKSGIHKLLLYLKEKGIKTAIATSSPLERTKTYLSSVGLEHAFDELVSGYMVKQGKPEPYIYLYAAQKLGLKPEECMVLEDSPTGILAAYRANCIPVMIPDQDLPNEETKQMLYAEAESLESVIRLLRKE
ncbi:MAG: HAD family phosphatase [Lachnospiraceae bacterium]|nr:HAD family phosphatase [Lachnospiraceae bacterium]